MSARRPPRAWARDRGHPLEGLVRFALVAWLVLVGAAVAVSWLGRLAADIARRIFS